MAVGTLVTNKMRSALTILGMVIGVTSIVGMTSLIRGFGDQMENLIRQLGSDTVYVSKMSGVSFAAGKEFWDLMRRPDITEEDARAIKAGAPSAMLVGISARRRSGHRAAAADIREARAPSRWRSSGRSANFTETNYLVRRAGAILQRLRGDPPARGRRARRTRPARRCSRASIRSARRSASDRRSSRSSACMGKRPEPAWRQPRRVRGHPRDDLRQALSRRRGSAA